MQQQPRDNDLPGPGDILGSFRLGPCLGEGGMGVVYRADHLRLPRQAAIKILKPQLARQREEVQRFFEEARAVNEVGHRNIVDITDFVAELERQPPLVYMVMESLAGVDLAAHLRCQGALPPAEVLSIALPVLDALHAAHRLLIVHRDLKPENVFLHQSPEGQVVKLLDFGVAKAFGSRRSAGLTSPGITLGTPRYMAPEQVKAKELDARTDIYAFGVMLYEMLAGRPPFPSDDPTEVMISQVRETPPPLPTSLALSKSLQGVVSRCLQKDPAKRFQTALEVRTALERCPEVATITERTPVSETQGALTLPVVAAGRPRGRRLPVLAGAGLLVAALVVIGVMLLRDADQGAVVTPDPETSPTPHAGTAAGQPATRPMLRPRPDAGAPTAALRRLSVESTPSGAQVFVDGTPRGSTPLTDLALGSAAAKLLVRHRGYVDHEETIGPGLRAEQRRVALRRVALRPRAGAQYGMQTIATTLQGTSQKARLYLDGRDAGETPLTLRLRVGWHMFQVRHERRVRSRRAFVRRRTNRVLLIPLD